MNRGASWDTFRSSSGPCLKFLALVFLTQELFKRRGGGGKVLKKVLYGEAPPRGPSPYLLIIYHFWQKMYPFRILSIDLRYPFHIPSLELCIAFTAVIALSLKCRWISLKTRKFSQPQNASVCPSGPAFYRPKWPISLPFHILQQVKSLPFHIPDLKPEKGTHFGRSLSV